MGRAMNLARKNGLNPTPLPADFRGGPYTWDMTKVIPKLAGFQLVHRASWEIVGRLVGQLVREQKRKRPMVYLLRIDP